MIIELVPSQVTNLKSALKLINSGATGPDAAKEANDSLGSGQVLLPICQYYCLPV